MDFYNFLSERLPNESAAGLVYYVSITGALMLICAAMNIIINRVLLKIISKIIRNNKYKWDDVLLETKVFQRIALIVPGVIFYSFALFYYGFQVMVQRIAVIYVFIVISLILKSL